MEFLKAEGHIPDLRLSLRVDNKEEPAMVNPTPLISVVVPVHNGEATLRGCLQAIFMSTYPRYEVIIVDDLSTDSSVVIAEQFPCILVRRLRRAGAADARNAGAKKSRGEILFFTDSDVLVQPDTLTRMAEEFHRDPECVAVFGSYTAETAPTNFFSVYKNLMHHFTHQSAREVAATFWTGCGAIRSEAFWGLGGFDPADTDSADVEDIALGYELTRQGRKIRLAKDIQVTHTKVYSFVGLLKSDILHRAVPWTKLIIRQRMLRNDLNTKSENFLSTALAYAMILTSFLGILFTPGFAILPLLLAIFVYLNRKLLGLFLARGGAALLLKAIPMTILFYIYCAAGFVMGALCVLVERDPKAGRALILAEKPVAGQPR